MVEDKKAEQPEKPTKVTKVTKVAKAAPTPVVDNPAKVKVKKEEVLCHLGFFIVLLLMYFGSVLYVNFFQEDTSVEKPSIFSNLEDLKQGFEPKHHGLVDPEIKEDEQIILKGHGGEDDIVCSLYIAASAIPKSGFGIFTTNAISIGETIFGESTALSINGIELSPHLLYMKQHAKFNNTAGGIQGSKIVATTDIDAGEELFFNFGDYPQEFRTIYQNLHPSDPSEEVLRKVDEITQTIIESIPMKSVQIKSKKKQYKKKNVNLQFRDVPIMDSTPFFQLMKETLIGHDESVSYLLPESDVIARSLIDHGGRSMYIPKHRSIESLIDNGICVNGVEASKSLLYERDSGGVATRSLKKGEVITTSPMLVTSAQNDERCLKVNTNGNVLCFLSFSSRVNEGVSTSDCDEKNSGDCPYNKANAYYQWSKYNQLNDKIEHLSILELQESHPVDLTMDIIASRDIEKGEEVVIDFVNDGKEMSDSQYMIRNDLVHKSWTETKN